MPDAEPKPVTIRTVAEECGVSISTVSRALNGQTSNASLVERVTQTAQRLGYVPNSLARSFKHQRVDQVLFAVEDIGNAAYVAMVRAIEPILRHAGLRLLLHSTNADVEQELKLIASLRDRFVSGLIISPLRVTDEIVEALHDAETPIVAIGNIPGDEPVVDNVRVDSGRGAQLAIEHLVSRGSRRIALLNGPVDTTPGRARLRGYRESIEAAGLTYEPDLVVTAEGFGFEDGLAAAPNIDFDHVDGLLAASDALAVSALHAMDAADVSVGKDVRVVGMDDAEMARASIPPLTSVNLGAHIRGEHAARMLVDRLARPDSPRQRVSVDPVLTVRESSE